MEKWQRIEDLSISRLRVTGGWVVVGGINKEWSVFVPDRHMFWSCTAGDSIRGVLGLAIGILTLTYLTTISWNFLGSNFFPLPTISFFESACLIFLCKNLIRSR